MHIKKLISTQVSNAPLISLRVLFGFMMVVSIIRFWANGWIKEFYIIPQFHFTYYGFGWVKALEGNGMYWLFGIMLIAATCVMLGLFYRAAIVVFFCIFTYVELIDVTTHLNHYYFVSLMAFLLIFVPASNRFSLDVFFFRKNQTHETEAWTINIFKFQLFIVYFYAGLAKLNPDWLFHALPLKIWLPAKADLPIIGSFLRYEWVAYFFSWFGAIYDLTIPFLLLNRKTRLLGFLLVVVFHISTGILFPIGMFPYIMILSSLIFFSATYHEKILAFLESKVGFSSFEKIESKQHTNALLSLFLGVYCSIQILFPFRFLAYPGKLFWHEQGYRFSWRVMLMEKMGYVTFQIQDGATGKVVIIRNSDFLTPFQEKQMSTQPDLILQFAHILAQDLKQKGFEKPIVTAEGYVTLNGARSKLFINSQFDLAQVHDSWSHKDWIIPYSEK
jgi:hypothetical protein